MRFFIVVTGYNCANKVQECWQSLIGQTYDNWTAWFIDDGSTDGTAIEINKLTHVNKILCQENLGAAKRRYDVIHEHAKDTDIIVLLGMDDKLRLDALEVVKKHYDNGKSMTYGNWVNQNGVGLPVDFSLEFEEIIHEHRSYRKVKYRSTALNTMYAWIFKRIKKEDFIYKSSWIKATTESPTMFAALEMCGKEKIGIVYEPIYIYYQGREDNARNRFGANYQTEIYNHVINLPKYYACS
jgi:glycosyltransferase involved in cell wall biosynthesis